MPLSVEEASRRFEAYSDNMQDSILVIESLMGSDASFSFSMPQVISNLESLDISTEEKNVEAKIKVLQEYQKVLSLERKRRSVKEIATRKTKTEELKLHFKKTRRSRRLGLIFKPNVLPAYAMAGQVPPQASSEPVPTQASSEPVPTQASSGEVPRPQQEEEMMFEL